MPLPKKSVNQRHWRTQTRGGRQQELGKWIWGLPISQEVEDEISRQLHLRNLGFDLLVDPETNL